MHPSEQPAGCLRICSTHVLSATNERTFDLLCDCRTPNFFMAAQNRTNPSNGNNPERPEQLGIIQGTVVT